MTILSIRTVLVIEDDLDTFKASWPCNHIPDGICVAFEYSSNGDLVDISWFDADTGLDIAEPEGMDEAAILALSQDAQAYLNRQSRYLNNQDAA